MATLLPTEHIEQSSRAPREIEVPASTAWPLVLALGFTLVFAGLLTSASVSILGTVLALAGCVGWFREVFPHEHEEIVAIVPEEIHFRTVRRVVERIPIAPDQVRAWLPVETYPISAGVKGGLTGSVPMAVLACLYGVLKTGSIWFPINHRAAVVVGLALLPPRASQSCAREPHRLVLVHCFADCFRDRCRPCSHAAPPRQNTREPALRLARRN